MSMPNGPRSRQRARKHGALLRDKFACHYCGVALTMDTMTLDHVRPLSAGGKTVAHNLVAACRTCNETKADRPYAAFKVRAKERGE